MSIWPASLSERCFETDVGVSGVRRKFSCGDFIHWHMVVIFCGVRSLWRHNLTSYSCFHTNVLVKFVDIIGMFFYTRYPYFMCCCTEYKLSALQVAISKENKLNDTTLQFITAKVSGGVLKQGSKTYSSLRQNNLQL